jgi:uncharacterized membrane protein YoaK (UPF0700 family)
MIDFFGTLRIWAGLERTAESNLRLGVILSFVAGATNAGGFLAVGLYTSHMTGMLSSIADNLVLGNFLLTIGALAAIAAFLAGAMTTAWLINWGLRRQMNSAYCLPLLLESLLLLVFGVFGASIKAASTLLVPMTVMILCFIMGLQNAVITKISKSEIRTTHVTGLITDLGIELGKLVYINDSTMPAKVLANRPKLRTLLLLIGGFAVGGLIGALAFKYWGFAMTLPLAVLVLLPTLEPLAADWRQRV